MKGYLILEDQTIFEGVLIGAKRKVISEMVFNTSMAGYTEVMTDPSYAGQAVCMTYPLIGNYGVCKADMESRKPWVDALIVRELSGIASNFRSDMTIQEFMEEYGISGIRGIDTRALTKILREKGTMNGMITMEEPDNMEDIIAQIKAFCAGDVVKKVTCKKAYVQSPEGEQSRYKVALLDYGAKRNIAASLVKRGCEVTIYPAQTTAAEILRSNPDGIMLSNGPGDPKACGDIIEEVKRLYESSVPVFAICLGHQLMALAAGADTYKLKYGHRGGNHPVKDLQTGRTYISSQNHGYVVDTKTLSTEVASPAFINVNDNTNEGLSYTGKQIFTVQFHPEACPGPEESAYLFDRFLRMMDDYQETRKGGNQDA